MILNVTNDLAYLDYNCSYTVKVLATV